MVGWRYPDGTFKPNQPITRAEVVTVVNKMIERTPDKEKLNASGSKRYKDLKPSFWAYYDVIGSKYRSHSSRKIVTNESLNED